MSNENEGQKFDFRRLLRDRSGPYVHAGIFSRIAGIPVDPNHAPHVARVKRHLQGMPLPGSFYAWDQAVHLCAGEAVRFDAEATRRLAKYEEDFRGVVQAFVRSYENQHVDSEFENSLEQGYLRNAWFSLGEFITYLHEQHPSLAENYQVPKPEEFHEALEAVFNQVDDLLSAFDKDPTRPRQITPVGELTRRARVHGMSPEDARSWAERKVAETAEAANERAQASRRRYDPAQRARMAMGLVPDAVSGEAWYKSFSNAAVRQVSVLQASPLDGTVDAAISELYQGWHRLDNALINYAEIVRHNHLYPKDRKPTDGAFERLADAVEAIYQQLPHDQMYLPSRRQFCKLRLAMNAAAVEVVEKEKSEPASHVESTRNGSAKDGRGPGYPQGRR